MCKSAFFISLKNSEKSTGKRLGYFLPFFRKMMNHFFSQNYVEMCPLDNIHMLKTFPKSDLTYITLLQRYGPNIISGPIFQIALYCANWSHNQSRSVLMG